MTRWVRHLYQPSMPLGEDGKRITGSKAHIELSRKAASEGMVLLKNENKTLPFAQGKKIAVFGKASVDYVKGGGGSGDVTIAYTRSLIEGLQIKEAEGKIQLFPKLVDFYAENVAQQRADGYEPGMTIEPEVGDDLLSEASAFTDTAVFTICRFSGEGWDRKVSIEEDDSMWPDQIAFAKKQAQVFPKGDFCLTEKEQALLDSLCERFPNVVAVLNVGGVIESSWIKDSDKITASLLMWQGGIEGGLAAADILCGDVNPSGKLTDTFADSLDDYPSSYNFHESNDYVEYTDDIYVGYRYFETIPGAASKVVYPFGFGLSYTTFSINTVSAEVADDKSKVCFKVEVTNTGDVAGKEVVQLYYSAPDGILGKPKLELGTFAKTKLLAPGESEVMSFEIDEYTMSSYDDDGKISKSCWILEKGDYSFYIGNSCRDITKADVSYSLDEDKVVMKLSAKLTPDHLNKRIRSNGEFESVFTKEPNVDNSIFQRQKFHETEGVAPCERSRDLYYLWDHSKMNFNDVADGKMTLDEFVEQLSIEELIHLLGGQPNKGISNTFGVGNMPEYSVPEITTTDGPAGVRILPHIGIYTTAWPCATMLACSFNTELATQIGNAVALEAKENNIGIWLAPACNIHRSPLCGRNFEYYSEDPVVSGYIGAAVVKGVQSQKIAATVKHFAFNNKETNRKQSDSRVSERAAREIYLKGFEIIVKESDPWCIMSSYNLVNGIHTSECKELLSDILRDEWGFDGVVMTDWWTSGEHYLEAKACNDLKMANGYPKKVLAAYKQGAITREEIAKAATNILKLILKFD